MNLPPVGSNGLVITDASGRRMRIKVEYLDEAAESKLSLPVLAESVAPPVIASSLKGSPPPAPPAFLVPPGQISKPIYDHPLVGGKFTIFVLMYGDYYDMHRRCIQSILDTCPPDRVEIRIGSNQLGEKSSNLIQGLGADGRISVYYPHKNNSKKYPVMRRMFWDPSAPITTKWLIWFDDDTMCDKEKDWLALLSQEIAANPDASMFGPAQFYTLIGDQPKWIKAAPWYKGRQFRDRSGKGIPNGNRVHFCTGSFWALSVDALKRADIPDARLGHNGGDWVIGEQLWQAGLRMKGWTGGKQFVNWSSVPRRGLSEQHPGAKPKA